MHYGIDSAGMYHSLLLFYKQQGFYLTIRQDSIAQFQDIRR